MRFIQAQVAQDIRLGHVTTGPRRIRTWIINLFKLFKSVHISYNIIIYLLFYLLLFFLCMCVCVCVCLLPYNLCTALFNDRTRRVKGLWRNGIIINHYIYFCLYFRLLQERSAIMTYYTWYINYYYFYNYNITNHILINFINIIHYIFFYILYIMMYHEQTVFF